MLRRVETFSERLTGPKNLVSCGSSPFQDERTPHGLEMYFSVTRLLVDRAATDASRRHSKEVLDVSWDKLLVTHGLTILLVCVALAQHAR